MGKHSLNRQVWHTEKLFSVHIVSPTHVLFGEFETWKKRDLFIVILTLLISLHALWGLKSLLLLNCMTLYFSLCFCC